MEHPLTAAAPLHSQRLTYRRADEQDREPLRNMLSAPSVTEPAGFHAFAGHEDFEPFFRTILETASIMVVLEDTLIGYLRIYPEVMDREPFRGKNCMGLGFLLGKPYHHHGYGTEMLTFWTERLLQTCDFCVADAFVDNPASNALIQKCGFRYIEDYTMQFPALGCQKTCHRYVR